MKTSAADFLEQYRREHATTAKILRAFPSDRTDFKPHERSSNAMRIGWMFVLEERMMLKALRGEPVMSGGGFPQPPATWQEVIDQFDSQYEEVARELAKFGDGAPSNVVQFFVAPKTPGDYSAMDFLWFMLFDQIHHRGQFSVYIRMVGAKLPSIYGPTADEPWN